MWHLFWNKTFYYFYCYYHYTLWCISNTQNIQTTRYTPMHRNLESVATLFSLPIEYKTIWKWLDFLLPAHFSLSQALIIVSIRWITLISIFLIVWFTVLWRVPNTLKSLIWYLPSKDWINKWHHAFTYYPII